MRETQHQRKFRKSCPSHRRRTCCVCVECSFVFAEAGTCRSDRCLSGAGPYAAICGADRHERPFDGYADEIPPDKLPAPQKLSGIGNVRIQITATPDAQMWFNQGLTCSTIFGITSHCGRLSRVSGSIRSARCAIGALPTETTSHGNAPYFAHQALAKAASLKSHASKRNASTLRRVLHMRRH